MNFRPLGERVLVKRTEVENKTASGIYIPDNAKEKPHTAEVVAIGNKVEDIKVGDIITVSASGSFGVIVDEIRDGIIIAKKIHI